MGILIEFPLVKNSSHVTKSASCVDAKLSKEMLNKPNDTGAQLLFFTGVRYERVGQKKTNSSVAN